MREHRREQIWLVVGLWLGSRVRLVLASHVNMRELQQFTEAVDEVFTPGVLMLSKNMTTPLSNCKGGPSRHARSQARALTLNCPKLWVSEKLAVVQAVGQQPLCCWVPTSRRIGSPAMLLQPFLAPACKHEPHAAHHQDASLDSTDSAWSNNNMGRCSEAQGWRPCLTLQRPCATGLSHCLAPTTAPLSCQPLLQPTF